MFTFSAAWIGSHPCGGLAFGCLPNAWQIYGEDRSFAGFTGDRYTPAIAADDTVDN
jgi:hypothetical protein